MAAKLVVAFVMIPFQGRLFDRPVHPFNLAVCPRVVRVSQPVFDAVGLIDHVKAHLVESDAVPVPRLFRELDAIVGALMGWADKGLFITTGRFTSSASDEATRDGTIAIDPIDGDRLCDLLKENRLGVSTERIEKVHIDGKWFLEIWVYFPGSNVMSGGILGTIIKNKNKNR